MNETVDDPWVEPKYLPIMVTAVPTVPDVGEREVTMAGGDCGMLLPVVKDHISDTVISFHVVLYIPVASQ